MTKILLQKDRDTSIYERVKQGRLEIQVYMKEREQGRLEIQVYMKEREQGVLNPWDLWGPSMSLG